LVTISQAAVVQCQPVALNWRGGTPPYFLSIIPGGQVSAAALIDFGQLSGTSLTWTANITAGTSYVEFPLLLTQKSGFDGLLTINVSMSFGITESPSSSLVS
jgi:hypothetical protein